MKLSYPQLDVLCKLVATEIQCVFLPGKSEYRAFGIPRGGIFAGLALARHMNLVLTDEPEEADFFIDDILDSGSTMRKWCDRYPGIPFFVLVDKSKLEDKNEWVVFPWETASQANETIEGNVQRILQFIGEDSERGGLLETPHRVAKAWKHWAAGYKVDVPKLLKCFEDGAEHYDGMVVVKDIPFYSHCEHHMAPFFGTATIAYIPDKKIVGLSKLSRVLQAFAQRLQVQERLTSQVAEALMANLAPKGVGVVIRARHLCMESRGVCQQGHHTETTALRGVIYSEPAARDEFLQAAK